MFGNSQVSPGDAAFTAVQLMVGSLPDDQGDVFAVKTIPYLIEKFPNAVRVSTGEPICERRVISCSQENQIQVLMKESENFNLVFYLNEMIKEFNSQFKYFQQFNSCEVFFAKKMCKLGSEINSATAKDNMGNEEPEKSIKRSQWREAIKILCEGCINLKSIQTLSTAQWTAEDSNSKLNQLFDKLCLIKPDATGQIHFIKYTIKTNYYHNRCQENMSDLVLGQFIGNGNVKIFCDTLQALLDYYNFVPENALICLTPEQATSIQTLAAGEIF